MISLTRSTLFALVALLGLAAWTTPSHAHAPFAPGNTHAYSGK
ncbi:MAG TPA: hypothetical protein VMI52_07240 [Acetobacteraceae bacterium]|nr:hypothetical protein [Acetobacteraceae bacterium]